MTVNWGQFVVLILGGLALGVAGDRAWMALRRRRGQPGTSAVDEAHYYTHVGLPIFVGMASSATIAGLFSFADDDFMLLMAIIVFVWTFVAALIAYQKIMPGEGEVTDGNGHDR